MVNLIVSLMILFFLLIQWFMVNLTVELTIKFIINRYTNQ